MAVIGCYTMDLYCDTGGDSYGGDCPNKPQGYIGGPVAQFTGYTEGDCIKQARKRGWKFSRDKMKCFCPRCSKK